MHRSQGRLIGGLSLERGVLVPYVLNSLKTLVLT